MNNLGARFGRINMAHQPNILGASTCHPKAHRLSKKCMNNLGARFGRINMPHQPQILGASNMPPQGSPFVEKMRE
jgi:hypothetical protein